MENFEQEEPLVQREKPDIQTTIEALKDGDIDKMPSANIYYGLSDLTPAELAQLKPVWEALNAEYRAKLLRALAESSENNYELSYGSIGLFNLKDLSADVRRAALELLWENESLEFMHQLISLAQFDADDGVRATAVNELGRFILAGELGDLPEHETEKAQETALRLYNNAALSVEIRRRALEAISNSSHDGLTEAIRKAYKSLDHDLQVSAIFAMGRSCDNEEWEDTVLNELDSEDAEKRFEAARAAGELTIFDAVPKLSGLIAEDDREIQEAAIWSLGEIGGKEALRVLNALLDVLDKGKDDAFVDLIEDAIGSASLVDGSLLGFN